MHPFNHSSWEEVAGWSRSSRPVWSVAEFPDSQHYTEKPSLKTNKTKNRKHKRKETKPARRGCQIPLELDQVVESCSTWVLETKLRSCESAASTITPWVVICPAPEFVVQAGFKAESDLRLLISCFCLSELELNRHASPLLHDWTYGFVQAKASTLPTEPHFHPIWGF